MDILKQVFIGFGLLCLGFVLGLYNAESRKQPYYEDDKKKAQDLQVKIDSLEVIADSLKAIEPKIIYIIKEDEKRQPIIDSLRVRTGGFRAIKEKYIH